MASTGRERTSGAARGAWLLVLAAVGFLAAGIWRVVDRRRAADALPPNADGAAPLDGALVEPLVGLRAGPHLVYLATRGPGRPRVAFASLADPAGSETVTRVEAERVHAAGPVVLCLGDYLKGDGMMGSGAFVLDARMQIVRRFFLEGLPSRVRCSADGRMGAATFFVRGDSYAMGGFSTRTYLLDLAGEAPPIDLETFQISDGGMLVDSPDVNHWGVTFAREPDRFYATCASGGILRLIEGSPSGRTGTTLGKKVECPSLSPDGKRIAFKHGEGQESKLWRLSVVELDGSGVRNERRLEGEERSVDDQVEWLDGRTLLYGLARDDGAGNKGWDVWRLDVDSERPAELFVRDAYSPGVVRR